MPKQLRAFDKQGKITSQQTTGNGYLLLKIHFAKWGTQKRYGFEISKYFEQQKLYTELREKSEVTKDVQRWKHVVITNDHPRPMLDETNTKAYAVGYPISKVEIDNNTNTLKMEVLIYDEQTIIDIKNGKVELSAGYLYDLVAVKNEAYDFVQKNITPNHIAFVKKGRCGSSCTIAKDQTTTKGEPNMNELLAKALGLVPKDKHADFKAIETKIKELYSAKDAESTELKKATDTLQAKLDAVPKRATDAEIEEQINKLADEKAKILVVAKDCSIADAVSKTSMELKKEIIKKHNPKIALDNKSEEYVNASYDMAVTAKDEANLSFLKAQNLNPQTPANDNTSEAEFNSKY